MRRLILVLAFLTLASTARAQETQPFAWRPAHRASAGHISDVLVWSNVVLDVVHSARADDKRHAFLSQGCRLGLTIGVTEVVKRSVGRLRPDGSDHMSFWSGHTATAMQAAGWRYSVGLPIAFGAGYMRMAADRHYFTDVAAGAGFGFLASKVCR